MREFRLLAHGKEFHVDRFLAGCKIQPSLVWHRGVSSRGHLDPPETSGFDVVLADSSALNRYEQDAIAIRYLEENFDDLFALGSSEEVEHYMVFIHDRREITHDTSGFTTHHSRRLLSLTLQLNMDAVTLVVLNRVNEQMASHDI